MHPLDRAAAALDAPRPSRRSSRKDARAEAKARRRAEKQARKDAARAAREQAEEEPIADEAVDVPAAEPDAVADSTTDSEATAVLETAASTGETEDEDEGAQRLAVADALVARLPAIHPLAAAIITGLLSGLAAVALAFGAARGCESVRDTDSCGGGIGLLAIVAILAIEVVIGANLLKAWQISDPFSTSFLGVGLVATLAMLIFLDDLDSGWMFLVIPLMTAVAFALSWWVTVRFIDEHPMTSELDSEHGEPDFRERSTDEQDSRA
jgi:hypothetical protein